MEQKLVRVPFSIEMAKKIINKYVKGRIVTRYGNSARILCWDKKDKTYPIAALVDNGDEEDFRTYTNEGVWNADKTSMLGKYDLMLEIPEYLTFKDGDIIAYGIFDIYIGIFKEHDSHSNTHSDYVDFTSKGLRFDKVYWCYDNSRFATEAEKQKLIDALKASKEPKAKEYLKRFFGIEEKPKCEFKFREVVLVRSSDRDKWCAAEFSNKDGKWYAVFGGLYYEQCIPYNEKTAHLLGTTEDCKILFERN